MNKKQSLMAQANQILQKVKELEVTERQKVGQLVIKMYEKNKLKDVELLKGIAKILGDPISCISKDNSADKITEKVDIHNE